MHQLQLTLYLLLAFTAVSSMTVSINPKTKDYFVNKSVLLTGASSGLGRAMAVQLVKECQVKHIILSGRNEAALEETVSLCNNDNNDNPSTKIDVVTCDLSNLEDVKILGSKALKLVENNRVDVLVNNGGLSSRSRFIDTNVEVDELLMKVNYLAGAALAKAVIPAMIDNQSGGGKIIWISSLQGLLSIPNRTSYAASKFAVQGYCESLRAEVASSGVSVHVASPGYIKTNLSKGAITGDGSKYGILDKTTENGADPFDISAEILNSCVSGKDDIIVAAPMSAKIGILIRFFLPSVYKLLMVSRYKKSQT